MKFIDAIGQARWHLRSLWIVLILLIFIDVLSLFGWIHSASHLKILLPPRIPESGFSMQEGEVPKSTVYAFAFYVWQSINHWPNNGMKDYKRQIERFSPFLTPQFKEKLIQDYNHLLNEGELQDRIRFVQTISNVRYDPSAVEVLKEGTWIVHLKLHLTEMVGKHVKKVKDLQIHYPIKVVSYDVDVKDNPWGLGLAGFSSAPKRLRTMI